MAKKRRSTRTPSQSTDVRVGFGYDVHQFGDNRKLILGGVTIPYDQGLVGHSDADVLLHAVCDALLGAAALGDIGEHFPNTDRRFKGISSIELLRRVVGLLQSRGFSVGNIDSTLVLQRPKVAEYIPAMQNLIAKELRIPSAKVSVKATTNEGMGFVGRGEGCAAYAVASLQSEL
jgi:2-C-methyl-D-erythritol 2,4-cyclodiphosphate synthase